MKARTVARELAFFALFQQEQRGEPTAWEKISLQDLIVNTVRSLSILAHEQLEAVGHDLAALKNYIVDCEIIHPDNANTPLDEPNKPVPIPTTGAMLERLEALTQAVDNMNEALYVPEVKALASREDVQNYALMLIRNTTRNQDTIDEKINAVSRDWRVDRLQKLDRTLIRLAVAELLYSQQAEPGTIIDEALELAKRFTTDESRRFIHGILGAIAPIAEAERRERDNVEANSNV